MAKFIVAIETVKIKEFLFSTNKLKVIRGASYLLDYLNQVEVPRILKKGDRIKEEDIIYVGAGNAKFFVERDTEEEAKKVVEEIIEDVKEKYEKEAPGAKVVGVYIPTEYGKEGDRTKKVWDDLDKLGELTAIEKSKGFSALNIDLPDVEKCELSGNEVAEVDAANLLEDLRKLNYIFNENETEILISENVENGGQIDRVTIKTLEDQIKKAAKTTGRISEATLRKIIASNLLKESKVAKEKKVGFYQYIKNYINELNKNAKNSKKVSIELRTNIDDFENEDSFIGFVYSDGDALGDFFKHLKNTFKNLKDDDVEKKYLDFLKSFSKNLDETTKSSLAETLVDIFKDVKDEKRWGEFLIVGGDDVCAVFDPTLALEISYNFQKKFEEKMIENMKNMVTNETKKILNSKITSSSGVIIAKAKTPIFQLFEQGIKLQKKAKEKRKEAIGFNLNATGFIDFQVIGSEGCVDIKSFRDKISPDDNKVLERSYSININKNDKNIKNFNELIEIIKEFKAVDFPSNKLRYIYDLKRSEKLEDFEKKMTFINILSKMKDSKHIDLIKKIGINYDSDNFKGYFKNIFDILEIYKFIDERKQLKGGDE